MDCNRAAFACGDCKSFLYMFDRYYFIFKHVHVILIALMAVKDAKTLFASATTIQMMIT